MTRFLVKASGGYGLTPSGLFDPAKPYEEGTIRTSTVFKFKGMESHVVVLTDLDKLDSPRDRRRTYVGMSRAKYALFMIAKENFLLELRN